MTEGTRKRRTIRFRISEEDYARLKLLAEAQGKRSLPDFARLFMHRLAAQEDGAEILLHATAPAPKRAAPTWPAWPTTRTDSGLPALKRRNRLLALRLTDEEYQHLKAACITAGGRNLSEFSRASLLSLVQGDDRKIAERLASLECRVAEIHLALRGPGAATNSNSNRQP